MRRNGFMHGLWGLTALTGNPFHPQTVSCNYRYFQALSDDGGTAIVSAMSRNAMKEQRKTGLRLNKKLIFF